MCLFINIYPSIYLFIYLSIYIFITVYLYIYLFLSLKLRACVCFAICVCIYVRILRIGRSFVRESSNFVGSIAHYKSSTTIITTATEMTAKQNNYKNINNNDIVEFAMNIFKLKQHHHQQKKHLKIKQ